MKTVPVRVVPAFESYRAEVEYIIGSNTERRQLTKAEIALAFKRLRELPREQGGTKKPRGGDRRSESAPNQSGANPTLKGRDEAASMLGVSTDEARALEKVFTTPGVPDELKEAVNRRALAPTPAAKAIRTELKRGRPEKGGSSTTFSKSRDEAAALLGVDAEPLGLAAMVQRDVANSGVAASNKVAPTALLTPPEPCPPGR